jgi:prepilin-type N-terminal cleavage/methylation domain-containing protein
MRKRAGFTLLEVMIVLAVLLIVVTLGYTVLHKMLNTYSATEEEFIAQADVQAVATWIDENVGSAYEVQVYATAYSADHAFISSDGFCYLYQSVTRAPTRLTLVRAAPTARCVWKRKRGCESIFGISQASQRSCATPCGPSGKMGRQSTASRARSPLKT